ncbi:MAG: NAD(P)H-dependent oxidoreductase [Romboutsia sp.]|nr:NAD(P)H-dependent oxidoreductase [Romboutsia sp.]
MKNVLIVSGHTDLNDSVANKTILEELEKKLPEAEVDYLDRLYPDYKINVKAEQEKLKKADIIVLQFPIFWYGMPSLMNKWIEDTFKHGFSHGATGDKLLGKKVIVSFTTGAPEEGYHKDGKVGYEIEDFLVPLKATCNLCGMKFEGFVYTGGVSYHMRNDEEKLKEIKAKSVEHADRVIEFIDEL